MKHTLHMKQAFPCKERKPIHCNNIERNEDVERKELAKG